MIRRWLRCCLLPSALCLGTVGCTASLDSLTGGLVGGPAPAASPAEQQRPPRSDELSSHDQVHLCLDAGRELDRAGNDAGATEQYERVLALDPSNFTAMRRLCVLYDRQAIWDKSEAMYKKVAKIKPKDADVWSDWGYSFYLRAGDKNWAEAESRLRHALELDPQHARAHTNLGMVLGHLKRYGEAYTEFRAAQLSEAEAHCDLAFVYWSQGKMDQAKQECRTARDMDSSCLKARDMLAALETPPHPPEADRTASSRRPRASTLTPAQWEAEHEAARRAVAGMNGGSTTPPGGSSGVQPVSATDKPWQSGGPITMPSGTRWMPVHSGDTTTIPANSGGTTTIPVPKPVPFPTSGGAAGTVTFE
jgi:Flp pilus assembly protein TadD